MNEFEPSALFPSFEEGALRPKRKCLATLTRAQRGSIFSGLALVLALVGIYGSMSYTVAQRTREIGIRIAVGADRRDLFRMILGRSLVLIAGGLGLGLIGSLFAGQGISALLFGVSSTSPSVFALTAILMIVTGLGAAYIPARRAARIDPYNALRQE
jgi:putative ABC transport system permease protein